MVKAGLFLRAVQGGKNGSGRPTWSNPHKNRVGGTMVAGERFRHSSRTDAVDIIDLGTWQEALVKALREYDHSS